MNAPEPVTAAKPARGTLPRKPTPISGEYRDMTSRDCKVAANDPNFARLGFFADNCKDYTEMVAVIGMLNWVRTDGCSSLSDAG
jgi:hypothetical protein